MLGFRSHVKVWTNATLIRCLASLQKVQFEWYSDLSKLSTSRRDTHLDNLMSTCLLQRAWRRFQHRRRNTISFLMREEIIQIQYTSLSEQPLRDVEILLLGERISTSYEKFWKTRVPVKWYLVGKCSHLKQTLQSLCFW